ncbi:hypothetical protein [Leptospira interrogans]|uniref:hypothetical protein n=1 Tax=Leptospira interrogans TaxID=173 RepID=UPI000773454A|nr:hypothetical protein [Leptospira interrogans]
MIFFYSETIKAKMMNKFLIIFINSFLLKILDSLYTLRKNIVVMFNKEKFRNVTSWLELVEQIGFLYIPRYLFLCVKTKNII